MSARLARRRSTADPPSTPNRWPQMASATPAWTRPSARPAPAPACRYTPGFVTLPFRTVMSKTQSSLNGLFVALNFPVATPTTRTRSPCATNSGRSVTRIVETGEESGALDDMLDKVATFLRQRGQRYRRQPDVDPSTLDHPLHGSLHRRHRHQLVPADVRLCEAAAAAGVVESAHRCRGGHAASMSACNAAQN